jgi:IS30 family transposase
MATTTAAAAWRASAISRSVRHQWKTAQSSGIFEIESRTRATFYFATPYHSWERGTNENTNGLIRQYLPKGTSMAGVTQEICYEIANNLNNRPRKRHGYKTPLECLHEP